MTSTDAPTRQLPRSQRRAQILRAAARAFSEAGYAATSMTTVADEAGITKLIVYRHFESKEALYRAVLSGMVDRLRQGLIDDSGQRVTALPPIGAILRVAREDPDAYKLLVWHAPREPQFEQTVRAYWEEAVVKVDDLIGSRLPDSDLRDWTVRRLWLYILDSVLLWLECGSPDADEEWVEMATDGLRALFATWTTSSPP